MISATAIFSLSAIPNRGPASSAVRAARQVSRRILSSLPTTRSTSAISANIRACVCAAQPVTTIRTWERGAGLTKACGSAACATAVAAARLKRADRRVQISLPGGELLIEWREGDDHVLMTGTATFEYEGRFDPALFASVA